MVKCKNFQCFLSDALAPVLVYSPWGINEVKSLCLASMTFLQADGAALTDYAPITLDTEGINGV